MRAIDARPVLYVVGFILVILAIAMLPPMAVDIAVGNDDWVVFGASATLTLFFGVLLTLGNWTPERSFNLRQLFLLTTIAWVLVSGFAALPFLLGDTDMSLVDALFESVSGLTTTGATVITGIERLPPGILLWRSLCQWLGGVGIIAMSIAVLPFLRVGGMQLFRSESSDRSDKVLPRAGDMAIAIGWIYLTLTVAVTAALAMAGMGLFDAVCHAMTSIATGGFSTYDASAGHFDIPLVHWIMAAAMVVGGLPFVRLISFARGDFRSLWRDSQVRWYLAFLAVASLGVSLWLAGTGLGWEAAFRHGTFNVVSIVTTAGFASTDYTAWGTLAPVLFLLLMLIGGCTGSTTGGIKVFRFEILFMVLRFQLRRQFSPSRVIPLTYQGKPFSTDVMISVMSFGFVFAAMILVTSVVLAGLGLDMVTAISGATSAYANVGPGLGQIIGPVGSFGPLPDGAKLILTLAMLLGRLEFFTLLVILTPGFWRG